MDNNAPPPFLRLSRTLPNSPVWDMGSRAVQLWLWLLLQAVYAEEGYTLPDGWHLQRGQLWTTFPRLRQALRYRQGRGFASPPLSTLKATIERFKEGRMIDCQAVRNADRKADRDGIVITICKYDEYNPLPNKSRPISRPNGVPGRRPNADPEGERKEERKEKEDPPPTPPPPEGEGSPEKKPIELFFPHPPPAPDRKKLNQAGFAFDPRRRGWWAPWTPERQRLADQYRDPVLPPERPPPCIERQAPSPGSVPAMPQTHPRLQPVFDYLEQNLRPQIWRTWFAPMAMTVEGDAVVFWTLSEAGAQHTQELYGNTLQDAFQQALGKKPPTLHFRAAPARPSEPTSGRG